MKRGFSLAEVIFASFIFGMVVLFVVNIYPSSMVMIRRGECQLVADSFAQTILEDLRSRQFANVRVDAEPSYLPLIYNDITYTPALDVFYHPDSAAVEEKHLKVATVTVRWRFHNRNQQVEHTMYLHNITR